MMDLTNEAVVGGNDRSAMELSRLSATEKQILIFSFYRDAELRGARLLFNIIGHLKDGDSQLKMTKHLSDETRHAWLWTRRIADLGGAPAVVPDGYQRRLGMRIGVPRGIVELLGLTVVVEGSAPIAATCLMRRFPISRRLRSKCLRALPRTRPGICRGSSGRCGNLRARKAAKARPMKSSSAIGRSIARSTRHSPTTRPHCCEHK